MTKAVKQPAWLKAALEYMPQWLEYQLETSQRPGCAFAVTHQGEVALAHCLGFADQTIGAKLRPSHRFRAASHSKSFTATGLLKLREQGRLRLDDPVGNHVGGLAKGVACLTLEQLLSHSAGLSRDGDDAGQWIDRRPFLDEADLRQALNDGLMIEPSTRFKYSNLAFGLLGLVIEEITGESYTTWIRREVVEASGLARTRPDTPLPKGTPLASGHSRLHPLGQRVAIAGDNPTHALASATGFVSTPSDLARFYTSLDPSSRASVLSAASRRDMARVQWRDSHAAAPISYGLGVMAGAIGGWNWFGHGGAFQSASSQTMALPGHDLALSVVVNAVDGNAFDLAAGLVHILRGFAERGAPTARTRAWTGRWWSLWDTVDLLPVADHVVVASPGQLDPFDHPGEIAVTGRDKGKLRLAGGFDAHGEETRLIRSPRGRLTGIQIGGSRYDTRAQHLAELRRRQG